MAKARPPAFTPGKLVKFRSPEQLRKFLLAKQKEQEARKQCRDLKS